MNEAIPAAQFDAELSLVRHLIHEPPWLRDDDRSMRAVFRRWSPRDGEPSTLMLASLWPRVPVDGWNGLDEMACRRAIHHAALVLHLVSLGLPASESGVPTTNLGAAAKAAGVSEGRFARLVNLPAPARLDALGRLFRQLRAQRVHLHLTAARPGEGEPEGRSTRRTLQDTRRDDLAALLVFLFTNTPRPAAARWAAGYYRTRPAEETVDEATAS